MGHLVSLVFSVFPDEPFGCSNSDCSLFKTEKVNVMTEINDSF